VVLFLFSLINCQQRENRSLPISSNSELESFEIDSSKFIELKYDSTFKSMFPKNSVDTRLTKEDLNISERILRKEINRYNVQGQSRKDSLNKKFPNHQFYEGQFIIDLEEYNRQYISLEAPNGDRIIHINLFCKSNTHEYWKQNYVNVYGGGNCYFHLTINTTKKELIEFLLNSVI
jgi:hypothetical protein